MVFCLDVAGNQASLIDPRLAGQASGWMRDLSGRCLRRFSSRGDQLIRLRASCSWRNKTGLHRGHKAIQGQRRENGSREMQNPRGESSGLVPSVTRSYSAFEEESGADLRPCCAFSPTCSPAASPSPP